MRRWQETAGAMRIEFERRSGDVWHDVSRLAALERFLLVIYILVGCFGLSVFPRIILVRNGHQSETLHRRRHTEP